jgi:hypothetical protein
MPISALTAWAASSQGSQVPTRATHVASRDHCYRNRMVIGEVGHAAGSASRSASTFSGVMTTTIQSGGVSTSTFVSKPRLIDRSDARFWPAAAEVVPVADKRPSVDRRAENLHLARAQASFRHVDGVVRCKFKHGGGSNFRQLSA